MRTLSTNQSQKEDLINENFTSLNQASAFGWRIQNSTGLVFAYWGGNYQNSSGALFNIAPGSITVTASTTNYVYLNTTTGVIANSTTIPTAGNIRIAKVVTDSTKITNVTDERIFALFPVGTGNGLSSGGNKFVTQQDFEVTDVTGLNVTTRLGRALMANPLEYTSSFVQNLNSTAVTTLPANSSGYIVSISASPYVTYISSSGYTSNPLNILGFLYYFTTGPSSVTLLVECTRSNLPRLLNIYETSLAMSGNLSKVNVFTQPWNIQNATGNLSTGYRYELYLKCLTADNGYSVNDIIHNFTTGPTGATSNSNIPTLRLYGSNGGSIGVVMDASIKAQSLTTFTMVDLTPASWQLRLRVYAIR